MSEKIRILAPSGNPGFYRFCFVVPGTSVSTSDDELNPDSDKPKSDGWVNQQGGGMNAYDPVAYELPLGAVLDSEVTGLGRRVRLERGTS